MAICAIIIAAFLWHHFGTDSSLPVLADSTPILLAVAGIIMSYLPPKREVHLIATVVVFLVGVAGTLVLSVARIRNEQSHKIEIGVLNGKLDTVGNQNTKLANFLIEKRGTGTMTEVERRKAIESSLRSKYILSHNPIDPQILAGNASPPADWINQELGFLGEHWTVSESSRKQSAAAIARSYIAFDGVPRFSGGTSAAEGGDYRPGEMLGFNVHYKATGPNAVELTNSAAGVYLEPDFSLETQKAVTRNFTEEVQREFKGVAASHYPSTLMPNDSRFMTAYVFVGLGQTAPALTQEDLNDLKAGRKIAFVVSELFYKDEGKSHHSRVCAFLQPPASPPGIWHYCDMFVTSD